MSDAQGSPVTTRLASHTRPPSAPVTDRERHRELMEGKATTATATAAGAAAAGPSPPQQTRVDRGGHRGNPNRNHQVREHSGSTGGSGDNIKGTERRRPVSTSAVPPHPPDTPQGQQRPSSHQPHPPPLPPSSSPSSFSQTWISEAEGSGGGGGAAAGVIGGRERSTVNGNVTALLPRPGRSSRPQSASLQSLRSDCDTLLTATTTTTTTGSSSSSSNTSTGGFLLSTLEGMLGAHLNQQQQQQLKNQKVTSHPSAITKTTTSLKTPSHRHDDSLAEDDDECEDYSHTPHPHQHPHQHQHHSHEQEQEEHHTRKMNSAPTPPPLSKFDLHSSGLTSRSRSHNTELLSGTVGVAGMSSSSPAGISEEGTLLANMMMGPASPESPKSLGATIRDETVHTDDTRALDLHMDGGGDKGVSHQTTSEALRDAMVYIAALAAGRGPQLSYPSAANAATSTAGPLSSSSSVFSSSASTAVPEKVRREKADTSPGTKSAQKPKHGGGDADSETQLDKASKRQVTTGSDEPPPPHPHTGEGEDTTAHPPPPSPLRSNAKKHRSSSSSSSSSSSTSSNTSFQRWRRLKDAASLPLPPAPLRILAPTPKKNRQGKNSRPAGGAATGRNATQRASGTTTNNRRPKGRTSGSGAAERQRIRSQDRRRRPVSAGREIPHETGRAPASSSGSPPPRGSRSPPLSPGPQETGGSEGCQVDRAGPHDDKEEGQDRHHDYPHHDHENNIDIPGNRTENNKNRNDNDNNNSLSDSYNNNNNNNTTSSILISSGGSSPRFLCPHPPSKEPARVQNAKERFAHARQVISTRVRLSPSPSPPPAPPSASSSAGHTGSTFTPPPLSLPTDTASRSPARGGSSPTNDSPVLSPTAVRREMHRRLRTEQGYKYIKKSPLERIRRDNSNAREVHVEQARRRAAKTQWTTAAGKTTWRARHRAAEHHQREVAIVKERRRRETEEKLIQSRGNSTTGTGERRISRSSSRPGTRAGTRAGSSSAAAAAALRQTSKSRLASRGSAPRSGRDAARRRPPCTPISRSRADGSRKRTGTGKNSFHRMQQKNHKNTPKRTKRGAESYDDDDEYIEDDDYLYDDDDEDGAAEYFLDEDDENEILLMLSQQDYMEEKEGGGGSGGRRYHEHAAPTASASNFSIRSTGEQTMDGTLQSVPSFSVVARAEVYQQALRSALPRYLPNGSAKANVEVRDQLQAVLHTLQRLHGSARHQMRHLNQQIDEACKALRYLKADIADCESEEETQRRMRWELHVEQHRRQRLMQILYNSKKSFERYTASRAVHLEKEVEFCASHTQPCIFSNKIEASFAGGRLSAHRRLTASLHAMHKKADQLAKDITRTKMERRLVMSSAAYQQGPGPHHRRVLFSSSVGSPNGSVTVGSPGKDGAQSLTALLGATTTLSTSPPSPMKTVAGGAGVELNTFAGFQLVRNAKENAPNAEEAWYMEDEIRRNEVQERDLYQAVVLIQKRIKRKTEELAELEDRKARANRFDESREAHRVERQLFRSESAAELIALKRRQSAGLIGESRRNTLLQMTPQRIERGRGVHRDSDGMLSIHSLGEDVQRQHQRRSPHRHHGGGGPDDSPANERTLSPWNAPPKEKGPYTFLTEIL